MRETLIYNCIDKKGFNLKTNQNVYQFIKSMGVSGKNNNRYSIILKMNIHGVNFCKLAELAQRHISDCRRQPLSCPYPLNSPNN
jgi:hypothetical protein